MTTFTTVIPVYNSASPLDKTPQFITGQQRQSEETIVVDDDSSDNTSKIVEKIRYCWSEAHLWKLLLASILPYSLLNTLFQRAKNTREQHEKTKK